MNRWSYRSLGVACLVACALGACGGDEPASDTAATVGSQRITTAQLEQAAAGAKVYRDALDRLAPYAPDELSACASTRRRKAASMSLATAQARCKGELSSPRTVALRVLIRTRWYELEAGKRGVRVPASAYAIDVTGRRALKRSGLTPDQALPVRRFLAYWQRLAAPELASTQTVSPADVAASYRANPERYGQPEQRYLRSVSAPSPTVANEMRAAVLAGVPFERLMERFGAAGAKEPYTGLLPTTDLVEQPDVQRAAAKVEEGGVGSAWTSKGWWVFKVEVVVPASRPTLAQARGAIEAELVEQQARAAAVAFNARLRARYQADTACDGDVPAIPECRA